MSDFLAAFDEAKQERLRQKAALWDVQPTAGAGDQGSAQSTAAASTLSASALATYIAQQQQAAIARQATDATRRRVYVGSLYYEVKEDEIRIPFSTFGDIVKIEMPRDAMTGLSKGFCFIEYRTEEAANAALRSMNGFIIHGRAIKVNMPTAPGSANAAAAQQQQQQQQLHPQQPQHSMLVPAQQPQPVQSRACRIYVGSVAYNVPEEQLKAVFSAFGPIKSCQMISDPGKEHHKGYGFIEYESEESANDAIAQMNNQTIFGRVIQVNRATARTGGGAGGGVGAGGVGMPGGVPGGLGVGGMGSMMMMMNPAMLQLQQMQQLQQQQLLAGMGGVGVGGVGMAAVGMSNVLSSGIGGPGSGVGAVSGSGVTDPSVAAAQAAALLSQTIGNASSQSASSSSSSSSSNSLDHDMRLSTASQRMDMMIRLQNARAESNIILLKNMITAADYAQENPEDFKAEVKAECSKFGQVNDVVVKVRGAGGPVEIFIVYATPEQAAAGIRSLDRRSFAGQTVRAEYAQTIQ